MSEKSMYVWYNLTLYVDRLVGGIPKHPDIVRRWQEANWPQGNLSSELAVAGITPETASEQTVEDLGANAQEQEELASVWTGFAMMKHPRFDEIAALETRNIRAMLKESANIIKDMPQVKVKQKSGPPKNVALRSKLVERVYPYSEVDAKGKSKMWIPLLDESGTPCVVKNLSRPIHVMTRQGERNALKKTDYVDDVVIKCALKVLNDGIITEDILRAILDHASDNGVGTDRSQGAGVFTYELWPYQD